MTTPAPIKVSFGLKKVLTKSTTFHSAAAVPSKSKPSFSFGDDDDDDAPPLASTSTLPSASSTTKTKPGQPKISTATLSRAQKLKQQQDIDLDSSVYEYDEVYDNMKEGSRLASLAKQKDAGERKPKYISRLLETAEVRKRDRVRAEDKMVQREREMEGEEFADKDAFVTPAYLAQQEELRKVEEEESRKEAERKSKPGSISTFLKNHQDAISKAHDAAVAASLLKTSLLPPESITNRDVRGPARQTEAELAAEVSARTGRRIEVNDDGIIIDKRELLSGGLNIIAKPAPSSTGATGFSAPISARSVASASNNSSKETNAYGGLSAADRGRQSRERHSREVERQMVELDAKRKHEAEELLEKSVAKVARRNDGSKVEELKRKAEERRLKREEDAKHATA